MAAMCAMDSKSSLGSRSPTDGPRTLLLDGGMGMELKKRKAAGVPVAYDTSLFSTASLRETPEGVRDLHRDYLRAGCQVVTTASYAATRWYLRKVDEEHRVQELVRLSVDLARQAITDEAQGEALIAGSVPPLGDSYQHAPLTYNEMEEQYREFVQALGGVDIFLVETVSSLAEAAIAISVIREIWGPSARMWVSICPMRTHGRVTTRCGAPIREAVLLAAENGADAVLFNCGTPELIGAAIEAGRDALPVGDGPQIGGYANFWEETGCMQGWKIENQEGVIKAGDARPGAMVIRQDLTDEKYLASVKRWTEAGATIIGGCCGIGPDTMEYIAENTGLGRFFPG